MKLCYFFFVFLLGDATTLPSEPVQCDVSSHSGCDVEKFERCLEPGVCGCLSGFVRRLDTGDCVAVQFFQGYISFVNTFSDDLFTADSSTQIAFVSNVRSMIFQALNSEGARGVQDIYVTSVSREHVQDSRDRVRVDWELAVMSSTNPQREELMRAYNKGVVTMSYVDPQDSLIKINGTQFILGNNGTMANFLHPFVEFSHCVDKNHNYCDDNADCFHSLGSFKCTCRQGYDDVSPDVSRTPGESCIGTCNCENGGNCSRDSSGDTECSCPGWYTGSRCQINGELILVITCSVVAGLILLIILLCVIRFCISRRSRKSSHGSTVGVGSLDASVVKLPRVWMDGGRPYELPPRDTRRWSYVSEPVKYVDEYVLDDYVHAGTLPLPRSHEAKKKYYAAYPAGTLNHGYSSSTLSARPLPRH